MGATSCSPALVVDDGMGLGMWVRVAVGVALAAVLWAAVMAGLVAQVVMYFVCKRCCQSPDRRHRGEEPRRHVPRACSQL
ncbi:hypothetical protein ACQ4PT_069706 [Festuca glaucescens]